MHAFELFIARGAIQKLKKKFSRTSTPHEDNDPENNHSSVPNGCQNEIPVDPHGNVHEPTQIDEVPAKSESVSALTPTPAFQTDNSEAQQVVEQSTIVRANTDSESLINDEPKEFENER